ncbi:MAG TPA: SDR family NAD(P)-dependent oxidoreductase [Steroidobacteraceae bacterium]|nr:SDR family NAD(P)-dependent oxidoreductase [Steroidobacteraceae bacterium]
MAGELNGATAIVTGAGRGFGRAIALRFAAEGAAVTVTARTRAQIDSTVAEIKSAGGRALAIPGDVTRREDVARVVQAATEAFGPVTLLLSNAGLPGPFGPIGVVDPDVWWASQAVHLRAPLLFASAVLPAMQARGGGRIIIVASRGGVEVAPSLSAYCVGKSTQIRFAQHLAAEGRSHGVRAFAIEPGTVITDMAEDTMASPDAQRWVPHMLESLKQIKAQDDPNEGLARCATMCVKLASGRYDALSGRYLTPEDDFDALARQEKTHGG